MAYFFYILPSKLNITRIKETDYPKNIQCLQIVSINEVFTMDKNNNEKCNEEMDYLNHFLNEQITRICVKEEEERVKAEMMEEEPPKR